MAMLDPSFADGSSRNDPTSGRTSAAVMQSLLASLDAASLALNELDPATIGSLHTNQGYMERVQRLVAPIFAFLDHGQAVDAMAGAGAKLPKVDGEKLEMSDCEYLFSAE